MNESELLIKDNVLGFYKTAEARFHFHPDVQVTINQTINPELFNRRQ